MLAGTPPPTKYLLLAHPPRVHRRRSYPNANPVILRRRLLPAEEPMHFPACLVKITEKNSSLALVNREPGSLFKKGRDRGGETSFQKFPE
jgi:hypothetical protein